jgi:hypothetical protein
MITGKAKALRFRSIRNINTSPADEKYFSRPPSTAP